jgi:circadian clock protein KaiC
MTGKFDASREADLADLPRVSTGSEGLDDILGGGLDANRMYLYEGRPGTGKTTMALQFLLQGVRGGESVLYISLSETKRELNLVAKRHDWSLDGVDIFELVPPETTLDPERELTVFHPAEMELSETTNLIFKEVERINPARVVLDSLSELRLLAQSPLRYRRQVLALKHFFTNRNCTVVLLDDLSSSQDDLQLHSIAHGVVMLEQLAIDYGAERRRLRVIKMRGIRFRGGYHDFTIERGGLRIFPRLVAGEHHKSFADEFTLSGNAELDQLLGGGLERGTNVLLIGSAGVGKSSVALTYAIAAAERGEHAVFFAFDEGPRHRGGAGTDDRIAARKICCFWRCSISADRSCRIVTGRVRRQCAQECRSRQCPAHHHRQPERVSECNAG